jgi:hypothetical protein
MKENTFGHMVARFQVTAGYKPSAREIAAIYKASRFLEAEAEQAKSEEQN